MTTFWFQVQSFGLPAPSEARQAGMKNVSQPTVNLIICVVTEGFGVGLRVGFLFNRYFPYQVLMRHPMDLLTLFFSEPETTVAERGARTIADFLNARSCQMGIFPVTSYDGFGPG